MSDKAKELQEITNYYAKSIEYIDGQVHVLESYVDNNSFLTEFNEVSEKNDTSFTMYKNQNENIALFVQDKLKYAQKYNNNIENAGLMYAKLSCIDDFNDLSIWDKLSYIKNIKSITKVQRNYKECYLITEKDSNQMLIEKETGLIIKIFGAESAAMFEFEYDINTKQEVKQPDITGYTVREME